jgi:hypothetical protein
MTSLGLSPYEVNNAVCVACLLSVNEDSHVLRRVRKIEPVAVSVFVFFNHNFKIHEIVPHGVITIKNRDYVLNRGVSVCLHDSAFIFAPIHDCVFGFARFATSSIARSVCLTFINESYAAIILSNLYR